jgi:hypothetical protein
MRKLLANAFEIGHPEGWTDHSTITMIGPDRPGFAPNVQVNQEAVPREVSAQQYFAQQRAEMSKDLAECRVIEQGDRLIDGLRAEYHVYTWRIPQGTVIRQLQYAVVRGGTLYTITCSAAESDWMMFDAGFDMIVAGFRFRAAP